MPVDDLAHQGKAETAALASGARLRAEPLLEDLAVEAFQDART
jgi:hypothetical protein